MIAPDERRNSEHRIEWLRSRLGQVVWLGIKSKREPKVHGHGNWLIVAITHSANYAGRHILHIRKARKYGEPEPTIYRCYVEAVDSKDQDSVVHGEDHEPPLEKRPKGWAGGLEDPPSVPDHLPGWVGK